MCWERHLKRDISAQPWWDEGWGPGLTVGAERKATKEDLVKHQRKQYRKRMGKGEHRMPSGNDLQRPLHSATTITWLQGTQAWTPGDVVTGTTTRVAKRIRKQRGNSRQFWHHVHDDNQIFKRKCLTNSSKHGTGIWAQVTTGEVNFSINHRETIKWPWLGRAEQESKWRSKHKDVALKNTPNWEKRKKPKRSEKQIHEMTWRAQL